MMNKLTLAITPRIMAVAADATLTTANSRVMHAESRFSLSTEYIARRAGCRYNAEPL
jgi:hypothetical protein